MYHHHAHPTRSSLLLQQFDEVVSSTAIGRMLNNIQMAVNITWLPWETTTLYARMICIQGILDCTLPQWDE